MEFCVNCSEKTRKYKCSKCFAPYCSVTCYRAHKDSPECTAAQNAQLIEETHAQQADYEEPTLHAPFSTDDTVQLEKLQQLDKSQELRNLLHNPHLRSLLQQIDVAINAHSAMAAAMQEPLFLEFANACLQVVEPMTEAERAELELCY
ncbi:zinc finger HIT domain-containing protein 3 [Drosophila ananassae]|uniref:zinc finger HIT domain-containing protein 3 n=1 Tax=Drosophila ananassae TaxID=7217 RepID=UPI0013A5C7EA|nr:zinc finger HIT domain-containing protein 3 [Drosophila ananassae]